MKFVSIRRVLNGAPCSQLILHQYTQRWITTTTTSKARRRSRRTTAMIHWNVQRWSAISKPHQLLSKRWPCCFLDRIVAIYQTEEVNHVTCLTLQLTVKTEKSPIKSKACTDWRVAGEWLRHSIETWTASWLFWFFPVSNQTNGWRRCVAGKERRFSSLGEKRLTEAASWRPA